MSSAQEHWIESHPYLREVAEFQHKVAGAFSALPPAALSMPEWNKVMDEYREGVPLLASGHFHHDAAAGEALLAGIGRLLEVSLPEPVTLSAGALREHLQASEANRAAAIDWIENGDPAEPPVKAGGLLRVLGWAAITRAAAPVLSSYSELRKDDEWMRGYCPVCGGLPAMAQLAPEGGQPRTLACPYCHAAWQFQRIGCPFCGSEDQNRLPIFMLDEEPLFRLDTCQECHGYLKTYLGNRDLELHLSDWSTLHLDVLAGQHQFERKAAPLFDI